MNDEPSSPPNGRFGQYERDAVGPDTAFPPELEAVAERFRADAALLQSRLPDPAAVAERIRAIPTTFPQTLPERGFSMSTQVNTPPDTPWRLPTTGNRPPRHGPGRGILAALAAVLVVALLAVVLVQFAARNGTSTGPIGQPTSTQPAPTQPASTATPTTYPVRVYFSKQPDSYNDPTAVFPLQRVAPTADDATYAIQQLIAGPTPTEAAAGYFTELTAALTGLSDCNGADFTITRNMRGPTPQAGTATLQFCRATTLPGDMTGPRITAEIDKTLAQFPDITAVVILAQDGHCFDDFSGADRCLQ